MREVVLVRKVVWRCFYHLYCVSALINSIASKLTMERLWLILIWNSRNVLNVVDASRIYKILQFGMSEK